MKRILIVRGGAIGDFVLTLPAIKMLRDSNPDAEIEVLGYKHIAELVNGRFYADRTRSIDYAPMASFFARGADLSPELADYLASFDLIISYLYDPDLIFDGNLRRCGVKNVLSGPAKISPHGGHAAHQLSEPLAKIGLKPANLGARVYPSPEDKERANTFLADLLGPIIAIHPGSGSEQKNWPLENWIQLGTRFFDQPPGKDRVVCRSLIVVLGEADEAQGERLEREWRNQPVRFARNLPLPHLAAILQQTTFLGHDSGISHIAAAAGANCLLLFGPTDPEVWAPIGNNVRVIQAAGGNLGGIRLQEVMSFLESS